MYIVIVIDEIIQKRSRIIQQELIEDAESAFESARNAFVEECNHIGICTRVIEDSPHYYYATDDEDDFKVIITKTLE